MAQNPVNQWAAGVLRGLGIRPSSGALQALEGWARAEGGHTNGARYNFLNTTQSMPGAGDTGTQGNIKVYKSLDQGVRATVRTLKNGRYGGILDGLQAGDASKVAQAIGASPWGTSGSLVRQTIAETHPSRPAPGSTSPSPAGGTPTSTTTRTTTVTPGVDNSGLRRQLVSDFLQQGGVKNSNATLAFASGIQGAQDTPGTQKTTTQTARPAASTPGTSQMSGNYLSRIKQRADTVDSRHLPYVWGGGHGGKVAALKQAVPVDCSGAVSEVLGINPRVSGQFTSWGKAGDGGNRGVTIYANGHHVLMKIDGKFFGTSGSNPGGGAGWIEQGQISPNYLKGFTARHA